MTHPLTPVVAAVLKEAAGVCSCIDRINAIRAIDAAALAEKLAPMVNISVKPIPWRGETCWDWTAGMTPLGDYLVQKCDCGGTQVKIDQHAIWHSEKLDMDAGKRAAQDHFQRVVISSIQLAPMMPPDPRVEKLVEALELFIADTTDYMKRNALGDPEKQFTVRTARAALAAYKGGEG